MDPNPFLLFHSSAAQLALPISMIFVQRRFVWCSKMELLKCFTLHQRVEDLDEDDQTAAEYHQWYDQQDYADHGVLQSRVGEQEVACTASSAPSFSPRASKRSAGKLTYNAPDNHFRRRQWRCNSLWWGTRSRTPGCPAPIGWEHFCPAGDSMASVNPRRSKMAGNGTRLTWMIRFVNGSVMTVRIFISPGPLLSEMPWTIWSVTNSK